MLPGYNTEIPPNERFNSAFGHIHVPRCLAFTLFSERNLRIEAVAAITAQIEHRDRWPMDFRDGRIVRWEDFGSKGETLEAAGAVEIAALDEKRRSDISE